MVEHIVLFQWKPEATAAQIAEVITELAALKTKIQTGFSSTLLFSPLSNVA